MAKYAVPCVISLLVAALYNMVALRKRHIPQGLIIPLPVTIRYFPALKEEVGYIRDAMKLRNIHGVEKLECRHTITKPVNGRAK